MDKSLVEPKVYTLNDMVSDTDDLVPGAHITRIGEVEKVGAVGVLGEVKEPGAVGLYFMQPNAQTTVFSLEDEDDGTADEYYGPCHEFYYILVGEFTMYWGKEASEIRKVKANKLHLKAGDMGYWSRGWKYSVKNTGKVPGTFFWGISRPPKGIERREVPEMPDWLKRQDS